MRIAVEGCAHGELEIIYETLEAVQKADGKKVDLLICCGDFQATRNLSDLKCMAVPHKYKGICTFYKYYSGEKVAPVLTIFIGGNHEASNYLQELPYGGWVAPNIYYLGYAGVVTIGGLRIAGISGIYKGQHLLQGHHEKPPYNNNTIRSVYHVRNLEIFRLKQLTGTIDIFLSHDWPRGITKYGNERGLLKFKPFFKADIESNSLGSQPNMDLLERHYPTHWFAAHLHCKFEAVVPEKEGTRVTKFLALDKCLPRRKFLQVVEVPHDENVPIKLSYDLEWLTILYLSNHLLSVKSGTHYMPGQYGNERWIYTPTEEEKEKVLSKFNGELQIPTNFVRTVTPYNPRSSMGHIEEPKLQINPQTTQFCKTLGVDDPSVLLKMMTGSKEDKYDINESITDMTFNNTFDSTFNSTDVSFASENSSIFNSTFNESPSKDSVCRMSHVTLPLPKNNHDFHVEKEVSTTKVSEDFEISVSSTGCDVSDNDQATVAEPTPKKFKRRNYSMYSNTL